MHMNIQGQNVNKSWIIVLLGMLTAIGPLSMDMYLPALPIVSEDLNTSASITQLSLTACLIGLAGGQLLFGPLSDIQGRKKPLLYTLAIYATVSLLCALSTSIWIFVGLRFVQGFTGAAGIVIARAAARDIYDGKDLTKAFALLALVNGAAPILAPITGGFILNISSWQVVFIIIALIGFLLLLSVTFMLEETLPVENRSEGTILAVVQTFGNLFKDKVFMGIALTQALIMSGMFAYIAGSPFVLQNIYQVTPQQFSLIFALNGLGIIIAAQAAGRLSVKIDEVKILLIGVIISLLGGALLSIVIIFKLSLGPILIALLLVVSSVGMVSTTSFSLGLKARADAAGSASAFLGLLPFIGGGIISPIVGIAGEQAAWPLGITVLICSVSAFIIFLSLVWGSRLK